jgi:hypothetical protein
VTDTPDPWGPYRATIEDQIETRADYLSRLRRSLAGEIASDRHYFSDKAHQLHTAACRMDRMVQDVDRWLGDCPATIEHVDPDGSRFTADCTLPAGHHGAHNDANRPPASGQLVGELRDLADTVERVSQQFGWIAPDIERDLTGARGTTTNSHDAYANLAVNLDTLGGRARRLSGRARELALNPGQRAVDGPGEVESPPRSRVKSPELEL